VAVGGASVAVGAVVAVAGTLVAVGSVVAVAGTGVLVLDTPPTPPVGVLVLVGQPTEVVPELAPAVAVPMMKSWPLVVCTWMAFTVREEPLTICSFTVRVPWLSGRVMV
jgi:hypothetical protein